MKNILLLAGDGIGPEISAQVLKIIETLNEYKNTSFEITEDHIGGSGYDNYGSPCDDKVLEKAKKSDAILLGAVGGYKWENIPFEKRPERGLLRLRKELDLFANLRPALCFDSLSKSSSLKKEVISGLDIMIVRELTSGVYFGEPRGISGQEPNRISVDTQKYTEDEISRVAHSAFNLARKRKSHVTSCEKANVMHTGILWREVVSKIHKENYYDVKLNHMYADNAAMQLVRDPKQFDVLLTDNLFGDILSDIAAMLTGSLGMLPSASLGAKQDDHLPALYEPVHGSAPDIAGQNKANPCAMILSFAMMLRYSFSDNKNAELIERSVDEVLKKGKRTYDIADDGCDIISTDQMGDAIINQIKISI